LASFSEHIQQVKRNIDFLSSININCNQYWDWEVTVSFYASVHLVNAILAKKMNLHYRSHEQIQNAISPFNSISLGFSEEAYLAYTKLQGLSRRARYLINEDKTNKSEGSHSTYSIHFYKSVKYLNTLLCFLVELYPDVNFEPITIDCIELQRNDLTFFKYKRVSQVV
jgi:hypothetical protein